MELAERHLAGLAYLHVEIEGVELEEAFRAAGWGVERELLMLLRESPDSPAEASTVIEPGEERMLRLMRKWILEEEESDPKHVDEHVESVRRRAWAAGERHFGIEDSSGALVSMTNLRSDGATAQVENVYTAPEARGRGCARTLVAYVTRLAVDAGHELTFITADDLGWPKDLYARLGFEPAARMSLFHKRL